MIKLLVFLAALLALAFGFSWLADNPGEVTFVWLGQRVETDTTTAFVALGALVVAILVLIALVQVIFRMPGSIFGWWGRRRREKGWAALSRGLIAIGAGDLATATKASNEARWILGDEPLALVLEAQSAQLIGDRGSAQRAFQSMLEKPETRLLGLRGLYVEAVRWGDGAAAARHAEAANRTAPKLAWAGTALADHRAQNRDWQGTLETIDRNRRNGIVDRATARRLRAVVLTADGLERELTNPDVVHGNALEAHGLAPDLVPAACLAARLTAAGGDLRKAARILEATWKQEPHPEIADTYAHLRSGDSARDRLGRIRDLVKLRANHPEGSLALARAAIEAREFGTARAALQPLLAETPTRRVCLAMAALEDGEHGDVAAARTWLTRAVHAPRDRAWVADGHVSETWAALSPVTGRLDAFEWKLPPEDTAGPITEAIDDAGTANAVSGELVPIERAPAAARTARPVEEPKPSAAAPAEPPVAAPTTTEAVTPPATDPAPETVVETPLPDVPAPPSEAPIRVPPELVEAENAEQVTVPTPPPGVTVPTARANGAKDPALPPIPDDPGTEDEAPPEPKKKRFRFFS